ncbi:hypothetical protein ACOSP7_019526 [Xanthoceras sorbifolium]
MHGLRTRFNWEILNNPSKGVDLHEGDWETHGSVKLWKYTIGWKLQWRSSLLLISSTKFLAAKLTVYQICRLITFTQLSYMKVTGTLMAQSSTRLSLQVLSPAPAETIYTVNMVVYSMVVLEGDLMKHFKSYKVIIHVVPKSSEGSLVRWIWEYEKLQEDGPTPSKYVDAVTKLTKNIDANLLKAEQK